VGNVSSRVLLFRVSLKKQVTQPFFSRPWSLGNSYGLWSKKVLLFLISSQIMRIFFTFILFDLEK